ncbi:glutamate--cysteine ligase [Saxibacter everestensis]|uniref:Putative glutamate--cysteine ligase 2 n=1 Tax=Saxibacter everestensis TaxID=2909229 RepID=A0ABY8QVJ8_9MICO|nr:glutamate--cysteine ligase [Brevibacteriaceae bacterium ZFBP1038]
MRTFGVEEELLLVDQGSGAIVPAASALLAHAGKESGGEPGNSSADSDCSDVGLGYGVTGFALPSHRHAGTITVEFQQEQIEIASRIHTSVEELGADIRAGRARADAYAQAVGVRAIALATAPLPAAPHGTEQPRFDMMHAQFGLTADEQLTCGCHVHVSIDSVEEGVAVLDRIRIWLPVLAALSTNSPFWNGRDTGYASFRTQVWNRLPATGPMEILGSTDNYRLLIDQLLKTEVLFDEGMVYFDARLSRAYPTVEIRVGDVCLCADDTVLLAALSRALVETAAEQWRTGHPPEDVPVAILRMAAWQASRWGLEGDLLHPVRATPCSAADAVSSLVDYVRPALIDSGDEAFVDEMIERIMCRGTGARRQRAALERNGNLADVVREAIRSSHLPEGSL